MPEDPSGDKSITELLLETLAEDSTFATVWEPNLKKMVYAQYIKEHVVPGNKNDKQVRALRKQKLANFLNVLKETNNPHYEGVATQFTQLHSLVEENKKRGQILFNSFYEEIKFLQEKKVPFSIILRTFGQDLDRVLQEVHQIVSPQFFTWRGSFIIDEQTDGLVLHVKSLLSGESKEFKTYMQMYEFFKDTTHVAIQDNHDYWRKHNFSSEYSKLFLIDK